MPFSRYVFLLLLQYTIYPISDTAKPFTGFQVDIAGIFFQPPGNDGIQQTQDRGFFDFQVVGQQISTSSGSNPAIPIHRIIQNVK